MLLSNTAVAYTHLGRFAKRALWCSCPATCANDAPSYTVRLISYPSRPAEQASSILISDSCPAGQMI